MLDPSLVPDDSTSHPYPEKGAKEVFIETCLEWPQNMPGRGTGNCCWQWVDNGD